MSILTQAQMRKVAAFARERCRDNDFGHTMEHNNLTVELSKHLAAVERANEEICVVAAYLHDIAKNNSKSHGIEGASEAAEFLKHIGAPVQFTNEVSYAISQHDNDSPKKTDEAKVLWDADKLQSIGPFGFARIFGNRIFYGKKDIYYAIDQARYWERFFFDRFYTAVGREAATPPHQYMNKFFELCDAVLEANLDPLLEPTAPATGNHQKQGQKRNHRARRLSETQMSEVINYARERYKSGDIHHGTDHMEITVRLAGYLAEKEEADAEICTVAAYLHDIAKAKTGVMPKGNFQELQNKSDGHGQLGAAEAEKFLSKIGAPARFTRQVAYAISQHDNDSPKKTVEAKILWDADKLQLVGPFGFARIVQYYLAYLHTDINYAVEQAKHWQQFFFERFCSDTGRALASGLHDFMAGFHKLCSDIKEAKLNNPSPSYQQFVRLT